MNLRLSGDPQSSRKRDRLPSARQIQMWPATSLLNQDHSTVTEFCARGRLCAHSGGRMPALRKMNPRSVGHPRLRRVSGIAIALLLAAIFLSSVAPIASVSAGNICKLACCAGRAPHAAGSCMNGTCHAAIQLRKRTNRLATEPTEKLCGLKTFKARTLVPPQTPRSESQPSSFQVSMLVRPCQPDCGAVPLPSASQRRPRETAELSFANGVRPPFALHSLTAQNIFTPPRHPLRSQASPRAPPILPT